MNSSLVSMAELLGWVLLHSLWQGAALAVILAVVLLLLSRQSAAARHAVSLAALLVFVAVVAATALRLSSSPAVFTSSAAPSAPVPRAEISRADSASPASALQISPVVQRWNLRVEPALPWLTAFWGFGVGLLSLRHLLAWQRLRSLRRFGTPARPALQATLDRLLTRLDRTGVRLLESTEVAVPMLTGLLKPVILLPLRAITGLGERELEAVLAHELAHFVRHDAWSNLVQVVIETLFFYHPAVWWIGRRLRDERENAADDLALQICADRNVYAGALAQLAEMRFGPTPALAATGGNLLARIRRILGEPPVHAPASGWLLSAPLLLIALFAMTFFHPHANAAPATPAATPAAPAKPEAKPAAPAEATAMRDANKQKARDRGAQDRLRYKPEELAEIESLYQVANKNWRSEEARSSLRTLLAKYDGANRTGCATLYMGQMSQGQERLDFLTRAVEKFSDCFYFDGCQVGGYGRYVLALTLWEAGEKDKARARFAEIKEKFTEATDHRGRSMKEVVEAVEKELATKP